MAFIAYHNKSLTAVVVYNKVYLISDRNIPDSSRVAAASCSSSNRLSIAPCSKTLSSHVQHSEQRLSNNTLTTSTKTLC
jgi:hypothetical protein